MGGACSADEERRDFLWENLRERIDPGIDGRIIIRRIFRK
jgi:hypothetical protein